MKCSVKHSGMTLWALVSSATRILRVQPFHPTTTRAFLPKRATSSMLFTTTSSSSSSSSTSNKKETPEWTTETVRSTFIEYFTQEPRNHVFQPSSPCAPLNDPTLLFTNAGMNQFKPIFLGQVDPNSKMARLKRAVNSQKCIRAGGKHNDLEDVGRDTYHHTFFEMLGTWSFGNDYFKREAIDYAWDILTQVYQLDPNRLYATYFEGDAANGLEPDVEARDYWLQYLPSHHVIGCSAKDNFWEMGETGPCGPCSEIHYDRIGNGRDASSLVNADDPNVLEIWNIVFIQYNREAPGGVLKSLPAKHIDTGMGLERLVSVLQNKSSNYDIDCFQALFAKIATMTDKGPYTGRVVGQDDDDNDNHDNANNDVLKDTAYRVIADHARTLTFAIADGAVPNNEGRGYVLRRILRRATRYGQQILHCPPGFFTQLVPIVVETFGAAFPELKEQEAVIVEIVQEEEQAFSNMLERGIQFFASLQEQLQQQEGKSVQVPGDQAFYLYDTLGFPIDLTQLMAEEAGMTIDIQGFNDAMQAQKDRSRTAQRAARNRGGAGGADLELMAEQTAWLKNQGIHPTDDGFKYKWNVDLPATVMAIYIGDNDNDAGFLTENDDASSSIQQGDFVGLVFDKSSYYAEAGGQVADTGIIEIVNDDGVIAGTMTVTDVQVYAGFILHKGVVDKINDSSDSGNSGLKVGTVVNCKVDYERRRLIAPNHSMTHVLNAALRQVLGETVDQRGSLCNEEKLRFDFSHKKALNLQELKLVEEICQATVQNAEVVTSQVMPLKKATAIDGVRAVFGEVYPDPVRVISIGKDTSIEFCGGTHLDNTAESEAFCIVEETAVAKGIRRITAVTKSAAQEAIAVGEQFKSQVLEAEKLNADETPDLDKQAGSIRKDLDAALMSASLKAELRARIEGIQKKASDTNKKALQQRVDTVLKDVKKDIQAAVDGGKKMLVLNVKIGADSKASQSVMNTVKSMAPDLAFFAVSEEEPGSGGNLMAFAVVPDALLDDDSGKGGGLKANEWVNASLEVCGGRGGGKPGNAQGQAKECSDVDAVLNVARSFAENKIQVETV